MSFLAAAGAGEDAAVVDALLVQLMDVVFPSVDGVAGGDLEARRLGGLVVGVAFFLPVGDAGDLVVGVAFFSTRWWCGRRCRLFVVCAD